MLWSKIRFQEFCILLLWFCFVLEILIKCVVTLCSNIKTSAFSWKGFLCGKLWVSGRSFVLNCWYLFSGNCNKSSGEAQWVSESYEGKNDLLSHPPFLSVWNFGYSWDHLICFLGHNHIWIFFRAASVFVSVLIMIGMMSAQLVMCFLPWWYYGPISLNVFSFCGSTQCFLLTNMLLPRYHEAELVM